MTDFLSIPQHQVTISGNTAGALAALSSGTVTLAGGNNITVSQAGNAVTISGAAFPGDTQTAISGISASDTLYTSGTVRFTGVGGGVTVSSNTGQRVDISVAAQSVQPETQTFVGGVGNSQTTYTSGTVNLSVVAGQLTIRSTTGQAFQFSASQSVQPETQTFIGGLANSETTYTSGSVTLSALGAITIRSTTGQHFQLSVNSQTAQTGISGIANSETTYTSGTVSLSVVAGNLTIRSTTGQAYQFSASQTVQTQGVLSAGVSTGGNTAGNTTVNTGSRFVLVGSNMVSLSQTTAAGATTISIDATQSVQTQSIIRALYDGANSITTGTVRLTDANGVTFSINAQTLSASVNQSISMFAVSNTTQSTSGTAHKSALSFGGAGIASVGVTGGSVVISVPAGGGAGDGGVFAGVSTFGNTAGSTGTVSTGNFVLVGSGPISLSQSTGAAGSAATVSINAPATSSLSATGGVSISTNGSTISIGVPMITHSLYNPWGDAERTPVAHGAGTLHMQPYQIPVHLQHDRVIVPIQYSQATNSTLTVTCSMWFGLYTRNASTLSMLASTSGTFSINGSGTASSGQNSGPKHVSFGWTNTVTASDYWLGFISRSTTAGNNASLSVLGNTQANSVWSGYIGSAVNASNQYQLGLGTWSASSTAIPASVGFTQLTGTGSVVQRAPMIWFLSQTV